MFVRCRGDDKIVYATIPFNTLNAYITFLKFDNVLYYLFDNSYDLSSL